MAVTVAFCTMRSPGAGQAAQIQRVRAMEVIEIGASTTTVARDGEVIFAGNDESTVSRIAVGSTPDADATAQTAATSAGFPVGIGAVSMGINAKAGDKVNAEAAD